MEQHSACARLSCVGLFCWSFCMCIGLFDTYVGRIRRYEYRVLSLCSMAYLHVCLASVFCECMSVSFVCILVSFVCM